MKSEALLFLLNSAFSKIFPLVGNLILALFLLLIGILVAKGLGNLAIFLLKIIRLDKAARKIGVNALLEKGAISKTASELLGDLIYWLVVFVVLIGVTGMFGLPVEKALSSIFTYMGVIFLAALILGAGVFLAGLLSGIVRVIMANLGLEGTKIVSRVIYYIVIVFVFLAALAELGFDLHSLTPHIGIILGMPALAAAIAFGLGCKDMAADFLHNLFKGE